MSNEESGLRFGVDLITFFHPNFWDLGEADDLGAHAQKDPLAFWDQMLDGVHQAGVSDLELTFAPADYHTAITAYGSVDGFKAALSGRGLGVVSGYFGDLEQSDNPADPGNQEAILESADVYARFLAATGGKFLVVGLPMRKSRDQQPPSFVDLAYATPIADLLNRIGAVTIRHGIRTALHTESHSVFWTPRDVDLFMMLTDPMYVAMCPDTGHIALGGADPTVLMQRHRDRLVIAHWKDTIGAVPMGLTIDEAIHEVHGRYFRRVGAGVIDWFAWSRLLNDIGYDGCTLLELDAVPDPIAEMTQARTYVETALARLYGSSRSTDPVLV